MASGVATLALKVAAIAAALAMLVVPSLGRCPSLGPAPPPPLQASPPPPAYASSSPPPPPPIAASPPPPSQASPPPPPPPLPTPPPPLPPAAQPAPGPGLILCSDCSRQCNGPCSAAMSSKCSYPCDYPYRCNYCRTEVAKDCKARGICTDGSRSCDCESVAYSTCSTDCNGWSCESCKNGVSRECGENCASQCYAQGCVERP